MTSQQKFERLNQIAATLNEINTIFNLAMRQIEDTVVDQLADLHGVNRLDVTTQGPMSTDLAPAGIRAAISLSGKFDRRYAGVFENDLQDVR
jgi:hypothetical protein